MSDRETPNQSTSSSLASAMRCGLFSNKKGEVLIVHDQPLEEPIQWVEYHKDGNHMFLVYESGASQDLGIEIRGDMQKNLLHGVKVVVSYLKDKKIQSTQSVTLLVQEY